MTGRGLLNVALAVLLLLNIGSSALLCAESPSGPATSQSGHEHHHGGQQAPAAPDHEQPQTPDCPHLAASCTVTVPPVASPVPVAMVAGRSQLPRAAAAPDAPAVVQDPPPPRTVSSQPI